eukprot:9468044-Pyramimonas_sp.AAC.3
MRSKKRGADVDPATPPTKHLKTDEKAAAAASPLSDISTAPLAEVPVANLKSNQVVLKFMVNEVVYLCNKSETDITLPQHHVVVLFPTKGSKFEKKAAGDGKSMEFRITSQDELIALGPVVQDARANGGGGREGGGGGGIRMRKEEGSG